MTRLPLYGRDKELEYLREAVARLAGSQGFVAIVEGAPGLGKTALLDAVVADAPMTSLRVSPSPVDTERPFGALLDVLSHTTFGGEAVTESKRLLYAPSESQTAVAETVVAGIPLRVADLLTEALTRAAESSPLLVVIDDAQWLDTRSAKLLGRLGRVAAAYSLGALVAMRPDPHAPALDLTLETLRRGGASWLRLVALDDADAIRLAQDVALGTLGPNLAQLVASTGGNPLLVVELVKALKADGLLRIEEEVAEISEPGVPPSLRATLFRRLAVFPRQTIDLLRWCAVLGSEFYVKDLLDAADATDVSARIALNEAIRSQILLAQNDKLMFAHDLIRETLYSDTAPALRVQMHRQVGAALARAGAFTRAVPHLLAGVAPGDAEGAAFLKVAADRVLPGAPEVAASLLTHYLAVTEPDVAEAREIRVRLVGLLLAAGRLREAEEEARTALAWAHDEVYERLLSDLVSCLVFQGRLEEVSALPNRLDLDEKNLPFEVAAQIAFARSFFDLGAARALAQSVLTRASGREPIAESLAHMALSSALLAEVRPDAALLHARCAVTTARKDASGRAWRFDPYMSVVAALTWMDKPKDMTVEFRDAARVLGRYGGPLNEPAVHGLAAWWSFLTGEWDEAVTQAEVAISRSEEFDFRLEPAAMAVAVLAIMQTHRGELPAAGELLDGWQGSEQESWPLSWARAVLLSAQGDSAHAARIAAATWQRELDNAMPGCVVAYGLDFTLILHSVGHDLLDSIPSITATVATRGEMRWAQALARACTGLVSGNAESLLEAARTYAQIPRPLLAAMAYEAAAKLMPFDEERGNRDTLDRAVELYEELGAVHDLERIGTWAGSRGAGIRRPRVGWESLTQAEWRVLERVCAGLSNREIATELVVSRRTIETHVAHIFQKMQVRGRPQLIARAVRERPQVLASGSGLTPDGANTRP